MTTVRRRSVPWKPPTSVQESIEPEDDRAALLPIATSRGKRALDIALAALVLLLVTPAWLIIVLLIRATSSGPVLFRQSRVGLNGRSFTMLKFRTMYDGVSDEVHRRFITSLIVGQATGEGTGSYKLHGDVRVTPVGRWLRRTSFDELPQLVNVLRGEMSLVGPRPPLEYEVQNYAPWQRERLQMRPGITGLWQVSGRNRLSYVEMCRIDLEYLRDWSLRADLRIIFRTPWVLFVDPGGAE